jgi:DNA-binding transcriptional ArsR family regulator
MLNYTTHLSQSISSKNIELRKICAYDLAMAKELHHPDRDQIYLSAVLEALSEPTRREIVLRLLEQGEAPCQVFDNYAPKTNLSYHYARLREAGVTRTRVVGPYRMLSVRKEDLAARFPGLLEAIVAAAQEEAGAQRAMVDIRS